MTKRVRRFFVKEQIGCWRAAYKSFDYFYSVLRGNREEISGRELLRISYTAASSSFWDNRYYYSDVDTLLRKLIEKGYVKSDNLQEIESLFSAIAKAGGSKRETLIKLSEIIDKGIIGHLGIRVVAKSILESRSGAAITCSSFLKMSECGYFDEWSRNDIEKLIDSAQYKTPMVLKAIAELDRRLYKIIGPNNLKTILISSGPRGDEAMRSLNKYSDDEITLIGSGRLTRLADECSEGVGPVFSEVRRLYQGDWFKEYRFDDWKPLFIAISQINGGADDDSAKMLTTIAEEGLIDKFGFDSLIRIVKTCDDATPGAFQFILALASRGNLKRERISSLTAFITEVGARTDNKTSKTFDALRKIVIGGRWKKIGGLIRVRRVLHENGKWAYRTYRRL